MNQEKSFRIYFVSALLTLSKARHKNDPTNYRGLGARTGPAERGRLFELFLAYSKGTKSRIDITMANKAIKRYHAKLDLKDTE